MKIKMLHRLNKLDEAQSVVEFALILPLLILILLGIIEFGWFFNAKITLTSAAREGVRVYAIAGEPAKGEGKAIETAVANATQGLILSDPIVILPTGPSELVGSPGIQMVTVKVTGKVASLTKFFRFILPDNSITMTSEASMRVEY